MSKLYLDYNPQYVRVALTDEKGELEDFFIEKTAMRGPVGNIYKGKVENVLSSMKAAFVNLGLERNGFLHVGQSLLEKKETEKKLNLSAGDSVMCQVVKDQFGEKGVRLSLDITLPGRYVVYVPNADFVSVSRRIPSEERKAELEMLVKGAIGGEAGAILRTASEKASDEEILSEIDELKKMWLGIKEKYQAAPEKTVVFKEDDLLFRTLRDFSYCDLSEIVTNDKTAYDMAVSEFPNVHVTYYDKPQNVLAHYGLGSQIETLTKREVELKNGGFIVIDRAEALTAIDVNTGKFVGGKNLEDTVFRTNLEAAKEIARQLRLRNIGGIIIVDFIDMTDPEHKAKLMETLENEVKKDGMRTTVMSMTSLGLVEMTRKRKRVSIDSYLLQKCPHCDRGYTVSNEHLIMGLREKLVKVLCDKSISAVLLKVNPEIADSLFTTRMLSQECATIWKGKRIYVVSDENIPRGTETMLAMVGSVLTLPPDARMLY